MIGPTTDAIPNILDSDAMYIAILSNGTENPIIVMAPENKPEAPAPATARPIMSIGEFTAAAQITDPTTKSQSQNHKVKCIAGQRRRTLKDHERP